MPSTASRLHASPPRTPAFELTASRQFTAWLAEQKASLAFTTYQAGKLFLLGLQPDGQLSIFNRTFERCMGLWASPERLLMSSLYQLWRFENALPSGQTHQGYDRLYLPQLAWTTGDLDIHDIAVASNGGHDIAVDGVGRPVFVNTLFSCLATVSETHSFKPVWQPPFISKLAAEDRCHLNGVAVDAGEPHYVSSVSVSDVADGWRDHRVAGGVVIDVGSGEVVARGLSMPHSPRLHRGRLYVLDSGSGPRGWASGLLAVGLIGAHAPALAQATIDLATDAEVVPGVGLSGLSVLRLWAASGRGEIHACTSFVVCLFVRAGAGRGRGRGSAR